MKTVVNGGVMRGGVLGVLCTLAGVLGLPLMPAVALLISWDARETRGSRGKRATRHGDLPRWLRWFQTPDERWPGGLYEDEVLAVLTRYGRYVCCIYWYTRNSMHGLLPVFARAWQHTQPDPPVDPPSPDYVQWQRGGWRGGYGWRWKPQSVDRSTWAEVPYFTIRRAAAQQ
ncbi:MAG: hypothetical protein KGI52_03720 [Burkholderiales bacterium]|nr:hypothetical protein [Burkholderiales bacterium]